MADLNEGQAETRGSSRSQDARDRAAGRRRPLRRRHRPRRRGFGQRLRLRLSHPAHPGSSRRERRGSAKIEVDPAELNLLAVSGRRPLCPRRWSAGIFGNRAWMARELAVLPAGQIAQEGGRSRSNGPKAAGHAGRRRG